MSGPATATSYEESVGSCGPPTPTTPPPPPSAASRGAPVRRQLDFTGGGDLDGEDDDEFLCRLADDIERGYSEAKLRAPPCVCGRGVCAVEQDEQGSRWKYVCPSRPKCNHVAFCEEVDLNTKSQATSRSHPKPSNPCAFNDQNSPCAFNSPSNNMACPRTPVNVRPQATSDVHFHVAGATTLFSDSPLGAGTGTLVNFSPQGEGTAALANVSPQGARATTPAKFIPQGADATTTVQVSPQGKGTPVKFIPQGAGTTTPVQVSPQGAGTTAPAKVSSQGARSNVEEPVCQCTAGKCKRSRMGNEDWYVCPIPKGLSAFLHSRKAETTTTESLQGKGACNYKVRVPDFKDIISSAQAMPCDHPGTQHQPITAVNTPSKSPMRPYSTPSPISPNSNYICFRCHEKGHWINDCPKQSPKDNACFKCGIAGHWMHDCPQRKGS